MDDEALRGIRDQFFEGGMVPKPKLSRDHKPTPRGPLTPEQMLNRIDARLRRVVVKACENSFPASKVVETLESFMFRAYKGKQDKTPSWDGILFEPPTVTHRKTDDSYVARFLFDGESPNGGFHRLLLHGLCQFHGLAATSSTMEVTPGENQEPISARLLTAVGTISGENVRLVNYIMQRKQQQQQQQAQSTTTTTTSNSELAAKVEIATTTLASLKV